MNFSLGNFPFNSGLSVGNFAIIGLQKTPSVLSVTHHVSNINFIAQSPEVIVNGDIMFGAVNAFINVSISNERGVRVSEYESTISDTFTSLDFLNGVLVGQNQGGIYALTGSDDDGEDIVSLVKTKKFDWEVTNLKLLTHVKGIGDVENIELLVTTNGGDYVILPYYIGENEVFFRPPISTKNEYYEVGVQNVEGGDFFLRQLDISYLEGNK